MGTFANFDRVLRPATHVIFIEGRGDFPQTAGALWPAFWNHFPAIGREAVTQTLGLSGMEPGKSGDEAKIYQAGVVLKSPMQLPPGFRERTIPEGQYASFLLRGTYAKIGTAFADAFQLLADRRVRLRPEFCIEHYLNSPAQVPEDKLLTEILLPIEMQ
ncbi:MAG: GyrI-like domain-containing protein [Bdellovibrionaceae bacterium]|nr:GyrI-like domain-containing protein [Pseudobdellovibrionaceae bacterium]